jgi:50S ribosomal protein L16 3-hydroxylase
MAAVKRFRRRFFSGTGERTLYSRRMTKTRLGGLAVAEFLHRHWQKKPLLARGAFPELGDFLQRDSVFELAAREDLESRLVIRNGRHWQLRHGPFSKRFLSRIRDSKWSLLVNGINHVLPAAQKLLQAFAFIPYARLDDMMVSFAPPGGGVGPHFDSYDVFLVQGSGLRRWGIGRCRDRDLMRGAPLRILRRFKPTQEWVLHPGDMLYLPPQYGHLGVAVTDCITYSIGFRAASAQELGVRFLEFLQDRVRLAGMYEDPDLEPQPHPAELDSAMIRNVARMLGRIRWDEKDVAHFLGCYLTEPKAHVVFQRPARPLPIGSFARAVARHGLRLALTTQMLFRGNTIFMNGDAAGLAARPARMLTRLADQRELPPGTRLDRGTVRRLYEWYRAGYIILGDA